MPLEDVSGACASSAIHAKDVPRAIGGQADNAPAVSKLDGFSRRLILRELMIPETDPKIIAAKLCEFARTNFVAEGVEFDEHSPLSQAGIDSFALVELVLFCERVLGVRVPDSHLTPTNLASMSSLANCISELARNAPKNS
jgi:acyl carrier protein